MTMNLDNTKIQDINEKLAICQYDDLQLVYNKEDMFINASILYNERFDDNHVLRFFKKQDIQTIMSTPDKNGGPSIRYYYKLNSTGMKKEHQKYSGYYIHQDLFQLFICWIEPKRYILYSQLLNNLIINMTLKNTAPKEQLEKLQNENNKLVEDFQKEHHKVIVRTEQVIKLQPKASADVIENIYLEEVGENIYKMRCVVKKLDDQIPSFENVSNSISIRRLLKKQYKNDMKSCVIQNHTKQEIINDIQNIIDKAQDKY